MHGLNTSRAYHLSQPFPSQPNNLRYLTSNLLDFKYFGDIKNLNTNQQANVQNVFKVFSELGEGAKVEGLLASVREESFADDFDMLSAPRIELPLVANYSGMHLSGKVVDGPNNKQLWQPTGAGKSNLNTEVHNIAREFINSEVEAYAHEGRNAMAPLC